MKKFISAILALLLLIASLTACTDKKANDLLVSFSSYEAARNAVKFRPAEGTFEEILCEDRVSVFSGSGEDKIYGMASVSTGEMVIPIHYQKLTSNGNFILAEGSLSDEKVFNVFYMDGSYVYGSDYPIEIEDVGGGLVKITEVDYSYVYDKKGEPILWTNFSKDYEYVSCENFVLAKSLNKNAYFIFNKRTGECVKSFYANEDAEPYVQYAGGNDFIVVYNYLVSESDPYKASVDNEDGKVYYDQKVFRVTVGLETPREIDTKRFVYKLHNRYDFGLSPSERANYPLKDGYFAESDYEVYDRSVTGIIKYVLSDTSLKIVRNMPKNVTPLLTARDGYAAAGVNSDKLYLYDTDLNVALSLPNENYQSVRWANGLLVAAKLVDSGARYGAFDKEGNTVIPFEYTYLSEFKSDRAIGVKDGKAYIVHRNGETYYCMDETFPFYWDGFALFNENGKTGVRSFFGQTLVAAEYDGVTDATRYGETVYLTLYVGELKELFILS